MINNNMTENDCCHMYTYKQLSLQTVYACISTHKIITHNFSSCGNWQTFVNNQKLVDGTISVCRNQPSQFFLNWLFVFYWLSSCPQVTVATDSPAGKKLGKLQKKLQQIQELKERQAKGEHLEANQVSKWLTCMLGSDSTTMLLVNWAKKG